MTFLTHLLLLIPTGNIKNQKFHHYITALINKTNILIQHVDLKKITVLIWDCVCVCDTAQFDQIKFC